jgi:hypothetical protein
MTHAQFDEAAADAHDNWWLTGEDAFLHVPSVMNVEGWNLCGHPGNALLTEPQRVLMMWSDLVGQTSNGGFIQFVDNFSASLGLAYRLIAKLEWPELLERLDRAFREQVGDPENPRPRLEPWSDEDDAATDRQHMIRELARSRTRWRPWARRRQEEMLALFSDSLLSGLYMNAQIAGNISMPFSAEEEEELPTEAAEAFDEWFYLGVTKAASRVQVGAYIRRHRDELCRLTD